VEGAAFAAGVAAGVEDGGDLGMGVVVEQLVDRFDDVRWGLAQFPGGFGDWQGKGVVLPALQSHVAGDRFPVPGDGNVGEQQAGHALAFSLRSGRVVPDRGEVSDQLAYSGFPGFGEIGSGGILCLVVGVLGILECAQRGVPVGFQGVGDEPVGGVDVQLAAAGQVGVVAGAFDDGGP
jgi:hypothetical protein